MSEWRTIDSAPNGKYVLLGHKHYVVYGYRYNSFYKPERIGRFFDSAYPDVNLNPQPTHWMPLPEPPTDATP